MGLRLPLLWLQRHLQPRDGDSETDRPDASGRGSILASHRDGGRRQQQWAEPQLGRTVRSPDAGPWSLVTGGPFTSKLRSGQARRPRLSALVLSLVIDRLLGEPPAMVHPVVWIGRAISWLERRAPSSPAAGFAYGAGMSLVVVGGATVAGAALSRAVRALPSPIA